MKNIKKNKEEETLDLQENKHSPEEENDMKKEKILKSLKKNNTKNADFRHLAINAGKGKKNE